MQDFELPEATLALQAVARDFARDVLAPHALGWDTERHFPVAEMRQAAALGMAALYVRDVVDVVEWLLVNDKVSGVFKLGSGQARSFRELAEAVFTAAGKPAQISYRPMPVEIRDKYQYFTQADMTRIRSVGYDGQFTSLEAGIADYVQGWLAQPDPFI